MIKIFGQELCGGYTSLIDYRRQPPSPKLRDEELIWLDERLQAVGVR